MNPNQPDGANRPTPLTDAEAAKHRVYDHAVNQYIEMQIVPASFARQLERETATLHAQIARMKQREGELRAALEENTGRLAFMTGAFRPHLRPEDVKANTDAFLSARAALQSVAKEGEKSLGDTPAGEGRRK